MADTERPHSRRSASLSDADACNVGVPSPPTAGGRASAAGTHATATPAAPRRDGDVAAILRAMRRVLQDADALGIAGWPAGDHGGAYAGVPRDGWLLDTAHGPATDSPPDSSRPDASPATATRTSSRKRSGQRGGAEVDEAEASRVMGLVDLAKSGDAEAFGQLYDHYVSTIYRYIYYRVGSYALAEDLTSETFLRALRALASFKWQGRDFGAWLVTIARNLVADHYKSGRFRLEVATGEILDHDSVSDGPEDDVLASITNETLMRALRELGPEQQECLVLRFLNGLSVAETALALAKSEGAIKQLQLRAVRNLAKQLPDGFR